MSEDKVKRAFLAVSDKTGIVEFATGLKEIGYEVVCTGGTASTLKQSELEILELPSVPGVSGSLEARLRLLQTGLTGALVADRWKPAEAQAAENLGQLPFDLVAVNFHPMSTVLEDGLLTQKDVMEYVDIGAGVVLRAAARNFHQTLVLCDPADYPHVLETLREFGDLNPDERQALAAKAFHYAAYYDSTIAQYLTEAPVSLPDELVIGLKKVGELPYGENPHQRASVYAVSGGRRWGLAAAKLLYGKEVTFNQLLGLECAWELAGEFAEPACALVNRAQPCGAATSDRLAEAFRQAWASDPAAAQNGVAAFNLPVDEETARALADQFIECVLAPDFSQEAITLLRHKKDIRLLTLPSTLISPNELQIHSISGGLLVEDKNNQTFSTELKTVTKRPPSEPELSALRFAWKVAKHSKSDACVLTKGTWMVGLGAGQPSKLDAVRLAVLKANDRHPILDPKKPLVLASDGPLTLRCLNEAAKAGVRAVIQPGGSSDDRDSIRACDSYDLAMVFVGLRHYKH